MTRFAPVLLPFLFVGSVDFVQDDGTPLTRRNQINFTANIACADDAANNRTNCSATDTTGAPSDAKYVVQECNGSLSNEQCLSALATGIVKVTTTTGVLSTAVAGDFPTLNQNTTGTAAALTANPANCADATHFATGVTAAGVADCEAIADADVPNSITVDSANGLACTNCVAGTEIALGSDAQGDVMYYDGTDWVRLPKGTAGQVLEMNAGATAPEWDTDDSGGATQKAVDVPMCGPGNSALGVCHTFTNLNAAFVEISNNASRMFFDVDDYTEFRIVANMNVAAVTGDVQIQCDTDAAFGTPTGLGVLNNVAIGVTAGAWTSLAGECLTAGGVYLRAGMTGGNGTEDPAMRMVMLLLR